MYTAPFHRNITESTSPTQNNQSSSPIHSSHSSPPTTPTSPQDADQCIHRLLMRDHHQPNTQQNNVSPQSSSASSHSSSSQTSFQPSVTHIPTPRAPRRITRSTSKPHQSPSNSSSDSTTTGELHSIPTDIHSITQQISHLLDTDTSNTPSQNNTSVFSDPASQQLLESIMQDCATLASLHSQVTRTHQFIETQIQNIKNNSPPITPP